MRDQVTELLTKNGAVLVRQKKHEVWKLPNGQTFVRSATPSDVYADKNSLGDLKRLLGLKTKGGDGTRRIRTITAGPDRSIKYEKSVNSSLADQLRLKGITERGLRDDIEMLSYQNDMLTQELEVVQKPCWFCRLRDRWRR